MLSCVKDERAVNHHTKPTWTRGSKTWSCRRRRRRRRKGSRASGLKPSGTGRMETGQHKKIVKERKKNALISIDGWSMATYHNLKVCANTNAHCTWNLVKEIQPNNSAKNFLFANFGANFWTLTLVNFDDRSIQTSVYKVPAEGICVNCFICLIRF